MMRKTARQQSRATLILIVCLTVCAVANDIPPELLQVTRQTTMIEAFRPHPDFDRHDPSNIIQYEDRYWVFYTRNVGNHAHEELKDCGPL